MTVLNMFLINVVKGHIYNLDKRISPSRCWLVVKPLIHRQDKLSFFLIYVECAAKLGKINLRCGALFNLSKL